jgi:hypothetical protein
LVRHDDEVVFLPVFEKTCRCCQPKAILALMILWYGRKQERDTYHLVQPNKVGVVVEVRSSNNRKFSLWKVKTS